MKAAIAALLTAGLIGAALAAPGVSGATAPAGGGALDLAADPRPAIGELAGGIDETVDSVKARGNEITGAVRGAGRDAREPGSSEPAPGSSRQTQEAAAVAASGGVEIKDFLYRPKTITVSVGDSVTWVNRDQAPHDADAFDGSFDTEVLDEGESASVTFHEPGSFRYFCSVHPPEDFPEFTGTVKVAAAGGGTSGGGTDGPGAGATSPGATDGTESGVSSGDAAGSSGSGGGSAASAAESGTGSGPRAGLASTGLELRSLAALGALMLASGVLLMPARRRW